MTTEARVILAATDTSGRAFASFRQNLSGVGTSIASARTALAGLGALTAGSFLAGMVERSRQAIDEFNDLRDATGASIENISALDSIARETGGTFDQVASILVKFNQTLKDADPAKGAGAVFKALNLDIAELKRLDPAEALRRTAVALERYADDGNKARAFQELFGKSVREVAPLMKDLAEANQLVAKTSTESAEEVDKYTKSLARFKANVEDLERGAVAKLITAFNQLIDAFRRGRQEGKSFFEIGWDRYRENWKNFWAPEPAERLLEVNKELEKTLANQAAAREDNRGRYQPRIDELNAEKESLREVLRLRQRTSLAQAPGDARPTIAVPEEDKDADRRRKEAERAAKAAQRERDREAAEERQKELRVGELRNQLAGERWREDQRRMKEMDELISQIMRKERERLELLMNDTPTRQLERQREEMELLARALQGLVKDENGKTIQITEEQYLEAVSTQLDLVAEKTSKAKTFAEEFGLTFSSAFEDAIVKGGDLSDVLEGLEQDILRIILRKQVTEPLGDLISSGMGAFFKSIFPSAKGNVFAGAPGLSAYSNTVVSKPTVFPFAKGIGLMGEAGAEAIMPLTRLPNGDLGVGSAAGAGGSNVTVNVINQGGGGLQVVDQRRRTGADGEMTIDVLVEVLQARMGENVANGSGGLSRGLENRYGLRPSQG